MYVLKMISRRNERGKNKTKRDIHSHPMRKKVEFKFCAHSVKFTERIFGVNDKLLKVA